MVKLGFGSKILCLVLASSIGLALIMSGISLRQFTSAHQSFLESYRHALFSDYDSQARSQVQSAVSMLQRIYEKEQRGELSSEQARKVGAELLRGMKYGETGYFWADTTEGVNVVLLGKPTEGTSRIDLKDAKGKYLIREIISNGVAGGGFTDYWFPKAGETTPRPKRGYSLLFKPFGWVVGTGNYVEDLNALVQKAAEQHRERLKHEIELIVAVMIAAIVLISGASLLVTRRLLRQVGTEPSQLAEIADRVAGGDLTCQFEADRHGIYGAMRQMVQQLQQVMGRVNQSSQSISAAAVQLNGNAGQMADSAHAIVSQAETVATASEEMASTSLDIANNCHLAAENSDQASRTAQNGADIVQNTVAGMGRIAERVRQSAAVVEQLGVRSDQIGTIVATIEDIADQTNLLALNAAIEAARAGDQGRGFAVVADEVRALADRTTKATHEIGQMIRSIQSETRQAVQTMEEGVREVQNGTAEAAKSGGALEEIQRRIGEVTMQINQIATAAEQQTATTREITDNIQRISGTVQMGAQNSREISEASASLSGLSADLQGLVRKFQI
jgi:methyl-accepting chemotaxis protein